MHHYSKQRNSQKQNNNKNENRLKNQTTNERRPTIKKRKNHQRIQKKKQAAIDGIKTSQGCNSITSKKSKTRETPETPETPETRETPETPTYSIFSETKSTETNSWYENNDVFHFTNEFMNAKTSKMAKDVIRRVTVFICENKNKMEDFDECDKRNDMVERNFFDLYRFIYVPKKNEESLKEAFELLIFWINSLYTDRAWYNETIGIAIISFLIFCKFYYINLNMKRMEEIIGYPIDMENQIADLHFTYFKKRYALKRLLDTNDALRTNDLIGLLYRDVNFGHAYFYL